MSKHKTPITEQAQSKPHHGAPPRKPPLPHRQSAASGATVTDITDAEAIGRTIASREANSPSAEAVGMKLADGVFFARPDDDLNHRFPKCTFVDPPHWPNAPADVRHVQTFAELKKPKSTYSEQMTLTHVTTIHTMSRMEDEYVLVIPEDLPSSHDPEVYIYANRCNFNGRLSQGVRNIGAKYVQWNRSRYNPLQLKLVFYKTPEKGTLPLVSVGGNSKNYMVYIGKVLRNIGYDQRSKKRYQVPGIGTEKAPALGSLVLQLSPELVDSHKLEQFRAQYQTERPQETGTTVPQGRRRGN